jgi:hypothetical protein
MPAQAGIQLHAIRRLLTFWIPAFAGMTTSFFLSPVNRGSRRPKAFDGLRALFSCLSLRERPARSAG